MLCCLDGRQISFQNENLPSSSLCQHAQPPPYARQLARGYTLESKKKAFVVGQHSDPPITLGQGMDEEQALKALLAYKRLAPSSDALETYAMSSEADLRVLQESDLCALDSTLGRYTAGSYWDGSRRLISLTAMRSRQAIPLLQHQPPHRTLYMRLGHQRPPQRKHV